MAVTYRVGEWLVEPALNRISRADDERHLEAKAMDVLVVLLEECGNVVSGDDLLARVWPGRVVESSNVHRRVNQIRRAFGDDPKNPAYIQTVVKRGYQLVASVESESVVSGVEAGSSGGPALNPRAVRHVDQALPFSAIAEIPNLVSPGSQARAIHHFERAIEIEPEYALAWAGLSMAVSGWGYMSASSPEVVRADLATQREAAERALALAPEDWTSHYAMAVYARYARDVPLELHHWQRVVDLNPGRQNTRAEYGIALNDNGFPREAAEQWVEAYRQDPESTTANLSMARAAVYEGQRVVARAHIERALRLDSDEEIRFAAHLYRLNNDREQVIRLLYSGIRQWPDRSDLLSMLVDQLEALGAHEAASTWIEGASSEGRSFGDAPFSHWVYQDNAEALAEEIDRYRPATQRQERRLQYFRAILTGMRARQAAEAGADDAPCLASQALAEWTDVLETEGAKEVSLRNVGTRARVGFWARASGNTALAESSLEPIVAFIEANPPGYVPQTHVIQASIHAVLSNRSAALDHLARAVEFDEPVANWLALNQSQTDPFAILGGLRSDESFVELVDRSVDKDVELRNRLQAELPGVFAAIQDR